MNMWHRTFSTGSIITRITTVVLFIVLILGTLPASADAAYRDTNFRIDFDALVKKDNKPQTPTSVFTVDSNSTYQGGWPSPVDSSYASTLPRGMLLLANLFTRAADSVPLVRNGNAITSDFWPSPAYLDGLSVRRTLVTTGTWPYIGTIPVIEVRFVGGDPGSGSDDNGKTAVAGTITLDNGAVFTGASNNPNKKQRIEDRKGEQKSRLGKCRRDWVDLFNGSDANKASFTLTACQQTDDFRLYYQPAESPTPPPVPAPTLTLTANPNPTSGIPYNTSSKLGWSTTNVIPNGCTASGGWSGTKDRAGSNVDTGKLTQDTTFTLTCRNSANVSVTKSVTVQVNGPIIDNPPPNNPTLSFSANPTHVPYNTKSKLTWSTTNVITNGCTASGGWSGTKASSGSSVDTANLTQDTTFTLTCRNATGTTITRSVTVQVDAQPNNSPVPAPTLTFSANPTSVDYNGQSNLTWSTTNVIPDGCTASDGWSGTKASSGSSVDTARLTSNTRFQLTCRNSAGETVTRAVTIQVGNAPSLTISASPSQIAYNGSSTINWTAQNVTSCTASRNWSGSKPTSGSQGTGSLTSTAVYELRCQNNEGASITRAITVGVESRPTVTITATPNRVAYNGNSTVTWTTSNTSSCWSNWIGWVDNRGGTVSAPNLTEDVTFAIQCWNTAGFSTGVQTVTIRVDARPTVTITATPNRVAYNGNSTVTWTTSNTSSCWSNWIGWVDNRGGTVSAPNLTEDVTFAIQCWNTAGFSTGVQTATIRVDARPTVSFRANPSTVRYNQPSLLTWTSSEVTRCTASGDWSGNKAAQGSQGTGNLIATRTYNLECFNSANFSTGMSSVQIVVIPPECNDDIDNDGDDLKDAADPGCHEDDDINKPFSPTDDKESHIPPFDGGSFTEQQ